MELWIRSQKNDNLRPMLLKVNEFEIGDYNDDMNCIVVNNLHCVGIYKTKERALEILDEIQRTITKQLVNRHKQLDSNYSFEVIDTAIYEMPSE